MQIEARQTGATVFCALSAIAATLWTSCDLRLLTLFGTLALLWWHCPWRFSAFDWPDGWLRKAAFVGAVVTAVLVMGLGTKIASMAYPSASNEWALGYIVLAAAVWTAGRGKKVVLRTGAIVFWLLVVLYGTIGVCSLEQINPYPTAGAGGNHWALALLWLPMARFWSRQAVEVSGKWCAAWAIMAWMPSLLCWLTLGPVRAANEWFALYNVSQSASILQILERFEVLVSAAVTAGVFCLLAYLAQLSLSCCPIGSIKQKAPALLLLTMGVSRLSLAALGTIAAALIVIFWAGLPMTTQLVKKIKNLAKSS